MWKTLTRGLRAPFERAPWSNRTSSEQSTAPNNQDNKFHLPCPLRLIPSLLEKCQTYPYLPFCTEQKQNQQGADSESRTDESCKNDTFHHQPCGLLGAVGWAIVLRVKDFHSNVSVRYQLDSTTFLVSKDRDRYS